MRFRICAALSAAFIAIGVAASSTTIYGQFSGMLQEPGNTTTSRISDYSGGSFSGVFTLEQTRRSVTSSLFDLTMTSANVTILPRAGTLASPYEIIVGDENGELDLIAPTDFFPGDQLYFEFDEINTNAAPNQAGACAPFGGTSLICGSLGMSDATRSLVISESLSVTNDLVRLLGVQDTFSGIGGSLIYNRSGACGGTHVTQSEWVLSTTPFGSTPPPVPVPAGMWFMLAGGLCLGALRRLQRNKRHRRG